MPLKIHSSKEMENGTGKREKVVYSTGETSMKLKE